MLELLYKRFATLRLAGLLATVVLILIIVNLSCNAQESVTFRWEASLKGQPLNLNEKIAQNDNGDSIQITSLRFYISSIKLMKEQHSVQQLKTESHLIDWEVTASRSLTMPCGRDSIFDSVRFQLGVDSSLQAQGIGSGDLDPVLGMYWTWQSGYINFKLEGEYLPLQEKPVKIALHLGGFMAPYATSRLIQIPMLGQENDVTINIELDGLLAQALRNHTNQVMSPGEAAVQLSDVLAQSFKVVLK